MAPKPPPKKKKIQSKQRAVMKMVRQPADVLDEAAYKHLAMLYDPCGADLDESVYGGDKGYVNRFKTDFAIGGGAGTTSVALFFIPGSGLMGNIETGTPGVGQVFTLTNSGVPGASFLTTNASKSRTVAACAVVAPIVSPNVATGQIHYGVVPASTVISGGNYSINGLLTMCTQRCAAANALINPLEVKWSPGGFDDRYSPISTNDDPSDRNAILIIGLGLPPQTGLTIRRVDITEWAPLQNTGITFDAAAHNRSTCDINCVIRNLRRKDPDWWWSLGRKALGGVRKLSSAYMTGGLVGLANEGLKYVR